jgi:replicative DNA helicase
MTTGEQTTSDPQHRRTYQVSVGEALTRLDESLGSQVAAYARPVPTGWSVLDEILGGGLHAGELLLLGGPPGVGKTITGLQWARNMAKGGDRVLYVCYEHEPVTLLTRLLTLEASEGGGERVSSRVVLDALAAAEADGKGLEEAIATVPGGVAALERLRDYADDLVLVRASGAHTTLDELTGLVKDNARDGRALVVFVDYLQKIPLVPEPPVEAEKVTRTVEGLKDLALAHEVSVVAISAVDRVGMEVRRIRMHHLRGSSAVSYEADVVLMLNDKHKAVSKVHLSYDARAAQSFRDWVVFSVEKNREGPNLLDVEFHKDFGHFRFDPDGGLVSERLVDERLDESEL